MTWGTGDMGTTPGWPEALALFKREQPFCWPLVALFLIIPFYLVIGWEWVPGRTLHVPSTALDETLPLSAPWAIVYGSLFLAALLPAFVLHDAQLFRRTVIAYIIAWLVAYAFFLGYPTLCPRPARVEGDGFFAWVLRIVYGSDHKYNCFPSLHVAQCFIAALACRVVNRRVGSWLLAWAALVALSTLFTKQHYVADAVAGVALAYGAFAIAFRGARMDGLSPQLRALAPRLAGAAFGVYGLFVVFLAFLFVA